MRTVGTLVLGLVLALAATSFGVDPAQASSVSRVTLRVPVLRSDGAAAELRGRVVGRVRAVRVEARTGAGTWRLVTRARVRHGVYRARVPLTARTQSVRVGVHGRYSRARTVLAARPVQRVPVGPTAPAVPTGTAPQPADACGPRPAKADGSLWSCTFVDNFSGTSLDRSKWLPQVNFPTGVDGARACAVDDGTTVHVANGQLELSVRKLAQPMTCRSNSGSTVAQYASGMVSTYHLFAQQYGRFEARMKNTATTAPGLQEAFWMWPDDRVPSTDIWPWAGEIDVSETYSQYPSLSVPFLHYAADAKGSLPGTNTAYTCVAERGVWNTYRLDWTAQRLEIFVNGKSCLVNTSADPAFQKPYIMAFTAALGVQQNAYTGAAPIPATTSIDYLRIWQ
jgi:beta-glucanase (GH16 family)